MVLDGQAPDAQDRAAVTALIGRVPQGEFRVVVRHASGAPVVLMNAPLLNDGTPMPTLYWLVGPVEVAAISTLEASGAINLIESILGLEAIEKIHETYAAARDAYIPKDHAGPRPFGGVGGTHRGVKCLHAHFANWLAGNEDAIGEWTAAQLDALSIKRAQRTRWK